MHATTFLLVATVLVSSVCAVPMKRQDDEVDNLEDMPWFTPDPSTGDTELPVSTVTDEFTLPYFTGKTPPGEITLPTNTVPPPVEIILPTNTE